MSLRKSVRNIKNNGNGVKSTVDSTSGRYQLRVRSKIKTPARYENEHFLYGANNAHTKGRPVDMWWHSMRNDDEEDCEFGYHKEDKTEYQKDSALDADALMFVNKFDKSVGTTSHSLREIKAKTKASMKQEKTQELLSLNDDFSEDEAKDEIFDDSEEDDGDYSVYSDSD
jgi:hypothetical protein